MERLKQASVMRRWIRTNRRRKDRPGGWREERLSVCGGQAGLHVRVRGAELIQASTWPGGSWEPAAPENRPSSPVSLPPPGAWGRPWGEIKARPCQAPRALEFAQRHQERDLSHQGTDHSANRAGSGHARRGGVEKSMAWLPKRLPL